MPGARCTLARLLVAPILAALTMTPAVAAGKHPARDTVFIAPVQGKLRPEVLDALLDLVVISVARANIVDKVTLQDVEAELRQEKVKDQLSCGSVACAAEITGHLGVRYLLATNVTQLGGNLLVTMSLIDTREHTSRSGQGKSADRESEYESAVTAAVREVLGVVQTRLDASSASSDCRPGMVSLPGGTFEMRGRIVTVGAFCMDVTEVTVEAYQACVELSQCRAAAPGVGCNGADPAMANHPINCVDWSKATAYCARQGKRLPSEAEWEWAARGARRGTPYPWGNQPPASRVCWTGEGSGEGVNSRRGTCPVSSYSEGNSPQAVHNLAGNVAEWTSTIYSTADDPDQRVVRGGGWTLRDPVLLRATYRAYSDPTSVSPDRGFRCVTGL